MRRLEPAVKALPSVCTLPVYGYDPFVKTYIYIDCCLFGRDLFISCTCKHLWLNLWSKKLFMEKSRQRGYEICDRIDSLV